MFENKMQTRAAICGTGILLAIIFLFAHLPIVLLIVPVAILFLGLVADPEETHAVWYGMLNAIGIFDLNELTDAEKANYAAKRHYFWFGEVGMAAILAVLFAVPRGSSWPEELRLRSRSPGRHSCSLRSLSSFRKLSGREWEPRPMQRSMLSGKTNMSGKFSGACLLRLPGS